MVKNNFIYFKKLPMKKLKGFTLVEVLLVVVIIAILAAVVVVAINPGRQLAQTNNTQRWTDVEATLNAVIQYRTGNRGNLPDGGTTDITATPTEIGSGTGQVDICALLVPNYLPKMLVDPTSGSWTSCTTYDTGYNISVDAASRVTVSAIAPELGETITKTQ